MSKIPKNLSDKDMLKNFTEEPTIDARLPGSPASVNIISAGCSNATPTYLTTNTSIKSELPTPKIY